MRVPQVLLLFRNSRSLRAVLHIFPNSCITDGKPQKKCNRFIHYYPQVYTVLHAGEAPANQSVQKNVAGLPGKG